MTRPTVAAPVTDAQRAVSDLHQRAELARALLVGSAWCERCKPLAWQVGMALAGKTWAAISRVRLRRPT